MAVKFTPENVTMTEKLSGQVPEQLGGLIIQDIMANSVMMQLAKYQPMTAQEVKFNYYAGGVGAYWVDEGERIQTSAPQWTEVKMTAHKLGVIIPVTREVLHYSMSDFFTQMRPLIAEAFYRKFDEATILGGVDAPFTQSLDGAVKDAGTAVQGALDIKGWDKLVDALTDKGYEPNAVISKVSNTSALRSLIRNEEGLHSRVYDAQSKALDGLPVLNVHKDTEGFEKGTVYTGDFDNVFYGIPYNMNYKIAEEGTISTITDQKGEVINLFEREMQALRVTADFAFMIVREDAFAKLSAKPASAGA